VTRFTTAQRIVTVCSLFNHVGRKIKNRKWSWIGHTLRKPSGITEKDALDWNPHGKRRRGRLKKTWKRTVEEEARDQGKRWQEVKVLAKNKVRWRSFVKALCSTLEEKDWMMMMMSHVSIPGHTDSSD
jgi:hypothetical protein